MIDLSNNMKHIQESIIGRKGASVKFTKSMLKSGYIVQYQDTGLAMYFDYKDIKKINEFKKIYPLLFGRGCFLAKNWKLNIEYVPIFKYEDNLIMSNGDSDSDIIAVWRVNMQPQILDQESLEHFIKGVEPIKINQ